MSAGDLDLVRRIGASNHGLAVISVTRPDGTIHSSLVNAGVLEHPITGAAVVGLVAAGRSSKLRYIRATGRASLAFNHNWEWVALDGPAEIAGPDDTDVVPAADVPPLLRSVFIAAGGTHDDWDEYDRVMAAERRAAVLIAPARIITN